MNKSNQSIKSHVPFKQTVQSRIGQFRKHSRSAPSVRWFHNCALFRASLSLACVHQTLIPKDKFICWLSASFKKKS